MRKSYIAYLKVDKVVLWCECEKYSTQLLVKKEDKTWCECMLLLIYKKKYLKG